MFRYLNFSRALKHCDGYHSLPASSYPWIHLVSPNLWRKKWRGSSCREMRLSLIVCVIWVIFLFFLPQVGIGCSTAIGIRCGILGSTCSFGSRHLSTWTSCKKCEKHCAVVQIHIHFFHYFFSPCSFNQQTLVIDWPSGSQAQQYYSAWSLTSIVLVRDDHCCAFVMCNLHIELQSVHNAQVREWASL
jgi:hypothetical protein